MQVFNTPTKKKESFMPIKSKQVNIFVCGPTVYDFSHLGHAKTYIQFDFIVKYLRHQGYKVFYLMNITDIDDRIINRAKDQKIIPKELAKKFEQNFYEDMQDIHNTAVTQYARATDYIPEIISQVKRLIQKGFAYKINDGYYFDLKKFPEYGKLSGRSSLNEDDAISRIDENPDKKNKGDFCLWKFSKLGEPFWETDIGNGRPGWHIEDTAITEKFFGPQYDIHGGARDLIFPHHEAEITQMESLSGKKLFVKYWLHTGFLNINQEKMSKSKGNFLTIREALKQYNYATLRFFFISNHYRSQINFSDDLLKAAQNSLQRINDFIFNLDQNYDDEINNEKIIKYKEKIYQSLDDDFDTPKAFSLLYDFIKEQNTGGKSGIYVLQFLQEINSFFDFMEFEQATPLEKEIGSLIQQREQLRKQKKFKEADDVRKRLSEQGIELFDTKEGVKWRKNG